jgi:regulator of sigma E protease
MSWFLAFAGFAVLIILHELGHFAVAKWVGMRVERFSLFFPPLIARKKRGETEYAIGAVPLGGYVKITGMNPHEELDPAVAHRAYYRQPVWKRIAVIAAGPAVNIVLAFVIIVGLILANGVPREDVFRVAAVDPKYPAAGQLQPGDQILAVDGKRGSQQELRDQIASHKCDGTPRAGCEAASPAVLTIQREGVTRSVSITPIYDASPDVKRTRLGFTFDEIREDVGVGRASTEAASEMWRFTSATVTTLAQIIDPEKRKEISGVVGSYETTRQAVQLSWDTALYILAIISLSLGVINLFPFLPLDGGHIFWALAEKVRGKAIPFSVMERAGFVGFVLVILLFVVGLTNDIERLQGEGFRLR